MPRAADLGIGIEQVPGLGAAVDAQVKALIDRCLAVRPDP
jgi:hypothetical protein